MNSCWTGLGIQVSTRISTRIRVRSYSEVCKGRLVRNPLDRFGHPGVRMNLDTSSGTNLLRSIQRQTGSEPVGPVWASRCPHGSRHESGYQVSPK
ncbi:unnamed protein product [Sphagnum balticum]